MSSLTLSPEAVVDMRVACEDAYPREACGLLLGRSAEERRVLRVVVARNLDTSALPRNIGRQCKGDRVSPLRVPLPPSGRVPLERLDKFSRAPTLWAGFQYQIERGLCGSSEAPEAALPRHVPQPCFTSLGAES